MPWHNELPLTISWLGSRQPGLAAPRPPTSGTRNAASYPRARELMHCLIQAVRSSSFHPSLRMECMGMRPPEPESSRGSGEFRAEYP